MLLPHDRIKGYGPLLCVDVTHNEEYICGLFKENLILKFLDDKSTFSGETDTPALDCWWCLP